MSATPIKTRLVNAIRPEVSPVEIEATFDHRQPFLLLPAPLAERLRLDTICSRQVTDEDGSRVACPYVGPLQVQFRDQLCYAGAVVHGAEVRIGFTVISALNPVVSVPTVFFHD